MIAQCSCRRLRVAGFCVARSSRHRFRRSVPPSCVAPGRAGMVVTRLSVGRAGLSWEPPPRPRHIAASRCNPAPDKTISTLPRPQITQAARVQAAGQRRCGKKETLDDRRQARQQRGHGLHDLRRHPGGRPAWQMSGLLPARHQGRRPRPRGRVTGHGGADHQRPGAGTRKRTLPPVVQARGSSRRVWSMRGKPSNFRPRSRGPSSWFDTSNAERHPCAQGRRRSPTPWASCPGWPDFGELGAHKVLAGR